MLDQVLAKINSASLQQRQQESPGEYPSFWKNVQEYFSDYTNATTLNGFRYLGEKNRSKFEKFLWLAIIGVSLGMCSFLIVDTYRKWDTTPVIINFVHNPTPVWKIPFPAVTICPETKFRSNVFNFTQIYFRHGRRNLSDIELKHLRYSFLLCPIDYMKIPPDEDIFPFIHMVAPSKEEVIFKSTFSGSFGDCSTMFSTVLTDEGICYSFNILDRDDIYKSEVYHSINFLNPRNKVTNWSNEKGYAKSAGKNAYPRRISSAGAENGMVLYLRTYDGNIDNLCRGYFNNGYKLILHHPVEIPLAKMQYLKIPFDEDVTLAIKPDVIKTSNSLRNYDPHKRGCYFANEKQLRYYKIYTQHNCLVECLSNYTLKLCNCISFHMPRQNTTRICGAGDGCALDVRHDVFTAGAMTQFNKSMAGVDCDCLPSCTKLTYNVEMSQTNLEWQKFVGNLLLNKNEVQRISRVSIFFKDMQFLTLERTELYGVTDFLANCGGLLGLFIGFSLITLLEILYYLTVRLGINLKKYGRHYWSGSEDLLQDRKK